MTSRRKAFNADLLSSLVVWAAHSHLDGEAVSIWAGADGSERGSDQSFDDWGDWNQASWAKQLQNGVCQSSYCIAGEAVIQGSNYLIVYEDAGLVDLPNGLRARQRTASQCAPAIPDPKGKTIKKGPRKGEPVMIPDPDLETWKTIADVATEVLGITEPEADALFEGSNSIYRVVRVAQDIARNHGTELKVPEAVLELA